MVMVVSFLIGANTDQKIPAEVNVLTEQNVLYPNFPWTPAEISTIFWHDASDTNTITESANFVSTVDDKSGNGNDLVQPQGTSQPTSGQLSINGKNTISFDGVNDWLGVDPNPFTSPMTNVALFVVYKAPPAIQAGTLFSLNGNYPTPNRWNSHAPWSDGKIYFDAGNSTEGQGRISQADWVEVNEVVMAGFYNSDSDSVQQVWKNGTLFVSSATVQTPTVVGQVTLATAPGSPNFMEIDFCEWVAIEGTVSTDTRQKIEGYLAWKWDLVDDLPGGHPYKNERPIK
jgi:hypothetical protein